MTSLLFKLNENSRTSKRIKLILNFITTYLLLIKDFKKNKLTLNNYVIII